MKGYLRKAAKAWAGATLNIKKFADAYVDALFESEDDNAAEEVREAFQTAYPMFGRREWRRFWLVGNDILLPQFMFKSDSFVGKLLRLKDHMKWQRALVSASEDGTMRVERNGVVEKIKLSDLTKKEDRALVMLLDEKDAELPPDKLMDKFLGLTRKINKTRKRKTKRTAREILDDMASEVVKYSHLRDDEWDFEENHGHRDSWNDAVVKEHEELLDEIQASRGRLTKLVREATGNTKLLV